MESLSTLKISQKLKQSNIRLLNYSNLSAITGCTNQNTLYKLTQRLVEKDVIATLTAGHFLVVDSIVSEFEIANFVYQPSYISLHSALSSYGILSQFVYSVTSITTRKTKTMVIAERDYSYSHVDQRLFWGYQKTDGALIASPEKALLDSLYFMSKGIISLDIDDLDLSSINRRKLEKMVHQFQTPQLATIIQGLNL